MSDSGKAVFLSYASQDAEAVARLAEALRAAGVEVWFDRNELVGGDAWDAKIRRQIAECALFVPVISASTQVRLEGYFRIEWRLAAQRTHGMAEEKAFLLPVVIDDTREADAKVPAEFKAVQWTLLRQGSAGQVPDAEREKFVGRVAALLRAGAAGGAAKTAPVADDAAVPGRRRKSPAGGWLGVAGGVLALGAAWLLLRPAAQEATRTTAPAAPAPAAARTPAQEARELVARAIAPTKRLNFTREDLEIAADLARKATELDVTSATAWGARARLEALWLHRNWDLSAKRRQAVLEQAKRALALNGAEPNALWAQATVLRQQRAYGPAIELLQRALGSAPDDNDIRRGLAGALRNMGRTEEAIAAYRECIRRDPRDALAYYSLSIVHAWIGGVRDDDPANVDQALALLDQALGVDVFATAVVQKAMLLAGWKGDLAGARAALGMLDRLPLLDRTDDRALAAQMWVALLEGDPNRALAVAATTTSTYFEDAIMPGPVSWMKALAQRVAGRESLAVEEWREAEAVLRARLQASPNSLPTQAELAITLAQLGRRDEAEAAFARYAASLQDRGETGSVLEVRFRVAQGDIPQALAAVTAGRGRSVWLSTAALRHDPWFAPLRGRPEFEALLTEPGKAR